MNQTEFLAITCYFLREPEKSPVLDAMGLDFDSHRIKNWCKIN